MVEISFVSRAAVRCCPADASANRVRRSLTFLLFVLLFADVLPHKLEAHPIDTVANIGVTSSYGKIITSDDGKEFIAVDLSPYHTIRSIDYPTQSRGTIGVRDSSGSYQHTVPIAFTSDGGVIFQSITQTGLFKVRRSDHTIEWTSDSLRPFAYTSGCDYVIAVKGSHNEYPWSIIHRDNGESQELDIPNTSLPIVLPRNRYIVSLHSGLQTMSVFDYQTGINRSNIVLPQDVVTTSLRQGGVGLEEIEGTPYAVLRTTDPQVLRRVSIIDGAEQLPISVPSLPSDTVIYSFSPDGRYVVANCYQDITSTHITIVGFEVIGSTLKERFTTQLEAPAVHDPHLVWISPQSFVAHIRAGSFAYNFDQPEPRMIAAGVEVETNLCLAQDGAGIMIEGDRTNVYFDIKASTYTTFTAPKVRMQVPKKNMYITPYSYIGDNMLLFTDFTTGARVKTVGIPALSGRRPSFVDMDISQSEQYVAVCIGRDTLVIQDLVDTSRSKIVACEGCGNVELGFSADSRHLFAAGEHSGITVNLDSLKVSSKRPRLRMGTYFSKQLRVNASNDVLVLQNSNTLAIYSIPNDEYVTIRSFTSYISQATALDSNTILCIAGDYIYFLNAKLELVDSIFGKPFLNRSTYSFVPDKRLFLCRPMFSDLLLLRYDNVTSSVSQITPVEHGSTGEHYVAVDGVFTLVANNSENIEVYTFDGRSVTHMANLSVPTPGSVTVQLPQSPGPYIIVDRDTGRSVVVVK